MALCLRNILESSWRIWKRIQIREWHFNTVSLANSAYDTIPNLPRCSKYLSLCVFESIEWSNDSLKLLNGKIFSYLILTKSQAFQKKKYWIEYSSPANITSVRVLCSFLEEHKFLSQVRNRITVALSMILVFYLNQWMFWSGFIESIA